MGENLEKNDETKLVAQIAHKTIRQIEDQLKERNRQLKQKNQQIEDLYEQISKLKTAKCFLEFFLFGVLLSILL